MQFVKEFNRKYRDRKILKIITIPGNGAVLDASCANGKFLGNLHKISPNLKLFGIDIADNDIEVAKANFPFVTFTKENVDKLSFPDNMFDLAFSITSLHHYKNPQNFFSEMSRVLKPNGNLYLADVIPKHEFTQKYINRKKCPEPYHFEKFYSRPDLEKILQLFDLQIIADNRISSLPRIRLLKIVKK